MRWARNPTEARDPRRARYLTRATPLLVLLASTVGAACAKKATSKAPDASAPPASSAQSETTVMSPDTKGASIYSAPIGATRITDGTVLVAGLVVPTTSITLTGMSPAGATMWRTEALADVAWNSDAHLSVLPVGDGAAVIWLGPRGGKMGTYAVLIGAHGETKHVPIEMGTAPCATRDAIVWVDPTAASSVPMSRGGDAGARGPAAASLAPSARASSVPTGSATARHIRALTWGSEDIRDLGSLGGGPVPSLMCGDHVVYAIADSDDDRTVRTMLGGDSMVAPYIIDDNDFGEDEERDFQTYSIGDDLGMVRLANSGAIALRDIRAGKLGAWQRLSHKLADDDDIELVDGDAASVAIVYTNDDANECSGSDVAAKSVHALRVDRNTHKDAPPLLLAPAECGKDVAPFWIGQTSESLVVGWIEQGKRGDAPIRGFAFQVLTPGVTNGAAHHVQQPSDALVAAACHGNTCYAVGLAREDGMDGMVPEPVKLLRYP